MYEACRITTTSPAKETKGNHPSLLPSQIEILKYGYKIPTKTPFELPGKLQASPTCFTPTPELDAWFVDNRDRFHCLASIQNLYQFPVKNSKEWFNEKFCQFKKIINDNDLIRVNLLTNMLLDDGNQHSFPVKTP